VAVASAEPLRKSFAAHSKDITTTAPYQSIFDMPNGIPAAEATASKH